MKKKLQKKRAAKLIDEVREAGGTDTIGRAFRVDELERLDTALIEPSPFNQRTPGWEDHASTAELVASVRAHGILQPLFVRPNATLGRYELIFGHRRLFAARECGLEMVPAFVRELDDRSVLRIQLAENLNRSDADPFLVGDAFVKLAESESSEELAARFGLSTTTVERRKRLAIVPEKVRGLVRRGSLSLAAVQELATLPPAEIERAAVKLEHDFASTSEKPTARDARDLLVREFFLDLKRAPWSLDDGFGECNSQVRGVCSTCPMRLANQRDLFGASDELAGRDLCTDPSCFGAKCKATGRRELGKLEEAGSLVEIRGKVETVLDEKEARKLVTEFGRPIAPGYVDLAAKCDVVEGDVTWSQAIGRTLKSRGDHALVKAVLEKNLPVSITLSPVHGLPVWLTSREKAKKIVAPKKPDALDEPEAKPETALALVFREKVREATEGLQKAGDKSRREVLANAFLRFALERMSEGARREFAEFMEVPKHVDGVSAAIAEFVGLRPQGPRATEAFAFALSIFGFAEAKNSGDGLARAEMAARDLNALSARDSRVRTIKKKAKASRETVAALEQVAKVKTSKPAKKKGGSK